MNKRNKLIIIGGTVLAIIVITVVSYSNRKAENSTLDSNGITATENSALEEGTAEDVDMALNATDEIVDTNVPVDTWEVTDAVISDIEGIVKKYYSAEEFSEELLVNDADKVKEAITEKRNGIEDYKDIKVLVRKGLEKDTFVAFTSYNTKFINIETLAPGMSVIYIVPDDEGKLSIQDTPKNKDLAEHINNLLKEEEITSLVDTVNSGFAEALEKDENLKTFVEKLAKETKLGKKEN